MAKKSFQDQYDEIYNSPTMSCRLDSDSFLCISFLDFRVFRKELTKCCENGCCRKYFTIEDVHRARMDFYQEGMSTMDQNERLLVLIRPMHQDGHFHFNIGRPELIEKENFPMSLGNNNNNKVE